LPTVAKIHFKKKFGFAEKEKRIKKTKGKRVKVIKGDNYRASRKPIS